jgi:hypothetical protein
VIPVAKSWFNLIDNALLARLGAPQPFPAQSFTGSASDQAVPRPGHAATEPMFVPVTERASIVDVPTIRTVRGAGR